MAKQKKEKIVWVDDGRTVADMSAVPGRSHIRKSSPFSASMKEKLTTFFDAIGFMLLPTLAMAGIIAAAFLIFYILF